jgi:hypothetical protein
MRFCCVVRAFGGARLPAGLAALLTAASILAPARPAAAIPAFSRQYRLRCGACHTVVPQLNPMGEWFRENGYFLRQKAKSGSADERETAFRASLTPDQRLARDVLGRFPISFKLTGDIRHDSDEDPQTRSFWDELLLNAGQGGKRWSFYVHQHLHKGGHDGKEQYAAWLQANDLIRSGKHRASLQAGLFELELGISPHTGRISSLAYLPYSSAIVDSENFTLGEPQAGLQIRGRIEPRWSYAVAFVTGSGLHSDGNVPRDLYFRLEREQAGGPAVGLFGYAGERELRRGKRSYGNDVGRLGLDVRWRPERMKSLHLFGILVWGSDDHVFTGGSFREAESLSGSVGADYQINRRTLFHGRLEWLGTDLPDGRQDLVRPVAGVHWLLQENFRITLEGALTARRSQDDRAQVFLGGLWAF